MRSSFGCSRKLVCFQERLQGEDLPLLRLCEALEQNKSEKSVGEKKGETHCPVSSPPADHILHHH